MHFSSQLIRNKTGTPPLFRYSRTWLQVRVSPQPPPAPAPSAFWLLWCPAVACDVQLQSSSEKGLPQSRGGNAHKLLLPLRVPACLFKLDHFWLSCLFSALKLKQEILSLKEGHLVMNTEVSQGSILGQILESKQMLEIFPKNYDYLQASLAWDNPARKWAHVLTFMGRPSSLAFSKWVLISDSTTHWLSGSG